MKKLKVGDRVKTSRPDGRGVICQIDETVVPYCVEFDKPILWEGSEWNRRWFRQSSVTLISKIQNKLK